MPAIHEMSAGEAARAIREGRLTSVQLVQSCLDRIAQRDADVMAWAWLDPHAALQAAKRLDEEAPRSLLHGVPVGIKDVIDTRDQPTAYQSAIYRGYRPGADAAVVQRAQKAGLVILGKTTTQEFATRGELPSTRNPHDFDRTPGGSSGGSAAAVADRQVCLAVSTQTAGSIVRPASYCGVVGFKPSFRKIDAAGVKSLVPSCDTVGVHTRSVEDAALALAALADWDGYDAFARGGQGRAPRIAILREPFWDLAEPASRNALETVRSCLRSAGIPLDEARPPKEFLGLSDAHDIISDYEARLALQDERKRKPEGLSPMVRAKLERGAAISRAVYEAARRTVAACRQEAAELYADCDCLLTPSAPGLAPPYANRDTGSAAFNKYWTTLGMPSINIPVPRQGHLPVGVQLVAPVGQDTRLLTVARDVERILAVC